MKKNDKRITIGISIALVLVFCLIVWDANKTTSADRLLAITIGMPAEIVSEIAGTPEQMSSMEEFTVWKYKTKIFGKIAQYNAYLDKDSKVSYCTIAFLPLSKDKYQSEYDTLIYRLTLVLGQAPRDNWVPLNGALKSSIWYLDSGDMYIYLEDDYSVLVLYI